MSSPLPSPDPVRHVKMGLIWFLGVAAATAVLVVSILAWIDTQKVPLVSFAATPAVRVGVDIRGAVSTPGVVYVNPGDRLTDVVDRSGGLAANADLPLINLSARVNDGQMIVIPTRVPEGSFEGDELININTASPAELDQLPGIGEVLAVRIVAYRESNGPFLSVDDLANVNGISSSLVETLRPLVRISDDD